GEKRMNKDDLAQAQQLLSGPPGSLTAGLEKMRASSQQATEFFDKKAKEKLTTRNVESEIKRREDETAQGKERLALQRAGKVDGQSNPRIGEVYAAMADAGLSFPSGMRSVKAQQGTIAGLLAAHPDETGAQIVQRMKSGVLKMAGEKTALNVVERREGASAAAINALNRSGGLYDQLLETGKKIDFGSAKFKNNFSLWKQGKVVADPDISEYVNVLADARAEFASVLARGGQVTDSVRIASEHAFPDTMAYSELQRNVERSRKVADSIQAGNTSVADAIINGTSMEEAMHKKNPPPAAVTPTGTPPAAGAGAAGGGPVKVSTPEEAAALAPGTVFLTPDGRRKVR
ncbi:MAG: hypothetical protein WCL08_13905, partial [Verrucomicrobiota bacterium]